MLSHLDLFSGIGGFALAAQWAGFTTIAFAEIDPFCAAVLKRHWPNVPNCGNVRNIEIQKYRNIDLLTGGFPCQPFSCAGKKKGTQDDRYLWPELLRIITEIRPRWFVGENVTGIIDLELDNILDDLEAQDYETETYIIPACAVQAPHRRERVWIVAHSLRERCDHGFNTAEERRIQRDWERDVAAAQAEWSALFPQSWQTFDFQNWLRFTAYADSQQCGKESENQNTITQRPERSVPLGTPGPLTNTESNRQPIQYPIAQGSRSDWWGESTGSDSDACDPDSITSWETDTRTEPIEEEWDTRERYSGQHRVDTTDTYRQESEPTISRMDDGIPAGLDSDIPAAGIDNSIPNIVDRNKSLGNAIVPQVVYPILRLIALMERAYGNPR